MKIHVLLLLLLCSIFSVRGESAVRWLATEHDFGAFDEDEGKVSCLFRFVNSGDEPVSIISVRATCGCTTSDYTRGSVAPGDTASVKVTFNPVGRAGRFDKKVYVDCSTTPRRTELTIKGVVVGSSNTVRSRFPIDAGPLKLRTDMLAFGELSSSHIKTIYLDAYNTTGQTLYPRWENLPAYISVAKKPEGIPPGDFTTFAISFDPFKCKDYGVITNEITLVAGETSTPVKCVAILSEDFSNLTPAQLAKAPVIKLSPTRIELPAVKRSQKTVDCRIMVTNEGKQPLLLRRVYSADNGVVINSFPEKIKKGQSLPISLQINLDEITSDMINARISIVSNSPSAPTSIVRIAGEIAP